jgi:tight adherence protein C
MTTTALDPVLLDLLAAAAALFAAGAVLFLSFGLRTYLAHSALEARLQVFVAASPSATTGRSAASPTLRARLVPFLAWVARRVNGLLPARAIDGMRVNLLSGGYATRRDLSNFLAAKALLAVLLLVPWPLLVVRATIPVVLAMLLMPIGALLGFYLPGIWLGGRIKQRRVQISRGLPDALDLLSISVSAGLGFDGALAEVVQRWQNPLTEELATVQRDMRLGKSRREAMRAFNDRAGVPDVAALVAVVVQAEEMGTPLRDALRVQSEQMRMQRRYKAEEKARQAVIKMLIPMVLFIFPAIFIVLLGPTVPLLLSLMDGGK